MGVLKEYRCLVHDLEFESDETPPYCPNGCTGSNVVREFRTPVGIGSNFGRTVDSMQKKLAADYGLTNMSNDGGRGSVMEHTFRHSGGSRTYRNEQLPRWAPNLFNPAPGWAQQVAAGAGEVPKFDFGAAGIKGQANRVEPILKSVPSMRARTVFQKPK